MTLLRNDNTNVSFDFGLITKINGDTRVVTGRAADIVYDVEIVGLDGPNVTLSDVSPIQRVTTDVDVRSMVLGTPVVVVTRYIGSHRAPRTEIWPVSSEKIPFDDCAESSQEADTKNVFSFFKKLVGRN